MVYLFPGIGAVLKNEKLVVGGIRDYTEVGAFHYEALSVHVVPDFRRRGIVVCVLADDRASVLTVIVIS